VGSSNSKRGRLRHETKTRALAKVDDTVPTRGPTPVLLNSDRPSQPEKPQTPEQTPEEPEDVLDLESLNLLDKEIPPDKLKKGDKIGSGGFKDVYEGKYRNVKVAIADFRGHLTDNDIKELSLLRDLRHENIVRFIGVSIPDEPRDVPCMIVTELCMNGKFHSFGSTV
jgi:hypothetical protein